MTSVNGCATLKLKLNIIYYKDVCMFVNFKASIRCIMQLSLFN